MTEEQLLSKLHEIFPTKTIYSEQRSGIIFKYARDFSRKASISTDQWLELHGFTLSETGYVEEDMQTQNLPHYFDEIFSLADWVLSSFPLIGEYEPTLEERSDLYRAGQEIVQQLFAKEKTLLSKDATILVVATVQLLKTRIFDIDSENGSEEEEQHSFWINIFTDYGIKVDNHSDNLVKKVYASFRKAIKDTMMHYRRFFAPEGTKQYYTTLQLHSLAPKKSMTSLFRILFDFYMEQLDFQYYPNDVAYKTFVKGMQARWKREQVAKVKLKSDVVNSGLKTLFSKRSGYMAIFCDKIVQKWTVFFVVSNLILKKLII